MVSLKLNTTVCALPILRGSTVIAPVIASVVSIATSNAPTAPCVFRDTAPISDSVSVVDGVTATVAEATLGPTALLATTAHIYAVPFTRLPTVAGENIADPVNAPGLQVAVYPLIGAPPSNAGGVKAMKACMLPGVAAPMVGAPGTTAKGVTSTGAELVLVP